MKIKVLGVHNYPQKNCFKVLFDGRPIDTPKMKTYGVSLITEKFCHSPALLNKFTASVGKEVNVSFDIKGNIYDVAL